MKSLLDLFKQFTPDEHFDAIRIGMASPEKIRSWSIHQAVLRGAGDVQGQFEVQEGIAAAFQRGSGLAGQAPGFQGGMPLVGGLVVEGALGGVGVRLTGQFGRDVGVPRSALAVEQAGVGGIADQCVAEDADFRVARVEDEAMGGGEVQDCRDVLIRQNARQEVHPELLSDDGGELQHLPEGTQPV